MFSKKVVTVIEISEESKQALKTLDADMQILSGFMEELLTSQRAILSQLAGEITEVIPASDPSPVSQGEEDRIRDTPFSRRPRSTQIKWLQGIMKPGQWYNAADLAQEYGNEPREVRYLRNSINGRFREMLEDGLVVRRESSVRGVMHEYRLK